MFLVDPAILNSLRPKNNQSRNVMECCRTANENNDVVFNLGMLRSYTSHEDVVNEVCVPLEKMNYTCTRIESEWITMLNRSVVTHLMIESSHLRLHVACFIKVLKDVYWVQEMQNNSPGALLGVNQSEVYDTILIQSIAKNGVTLPAPADIDSFLRQVPTSRFISCDQKLARDVTSAGDAKSEAVQANTRQSMIQMKRLMSKIAVPFFLMSGTLLGWFRECRAITYTTDADFATWARFATQEVEDQILALTHHNPSYRVFNIFGRFYMGYEMSFLLRNGFKSDLFFLYDESGNQLSSSGHVISQQLYYKYFYPTFPLCSTIFLGVRVNVPCDPEKILSTEYGDWKTPVEDSAYSYRTSPRNRGPAIKYPSGMDPLFREFP